MIIGPRPAASERESDRVLNVDYKRTLKPLFCQMMYERVAIHNRNVLAICTGPTGCLFQGTTIWVNNKKKKISSAPEFFVTKAFDGQKIVDTPAILKNTGIKQGIEIEFANGKKVIASPEHKWLSDGKWKQTDQLCVGDKIETAKQNIRRTKKVCNRKLFYNDQQGNFRKDRYMPENNNYDSMPQWEKENQRNIIESLKRSRKEEFESSRTHRKIAPIIQHRRNSNGISKPEECKFVSRKVQNNIGSYKVYFEKDRRGQTIIRSPCFNNGRTEKIYNRKLSDNEQQGNFRKDRCMREINNRDSLQKWNKEATRILCKPYKKLEKKQSENRPDLSKEKRRMYRGIAPFIQYRGNNKRIPETNKYGIVSKKIQHNNMVYKRDFNENWRDQTIAEKLRRAKQSVLWKEDAARNNSTDQYNQNKKWNKLLFYRTPERSCQIDLCQEQQGTWKDRNDSNRENHDEQIIGSGLSGEQGLFLQQSNKDKFYILVPGLSNTKQKSDNRMRWRILAFGQGEGSSERQRTTIAWLQSSALSRKRNQEWTICEEAIVRITKLETIRTYDLTVPEFGNYMLGDGMIVHNSGKSYAALRMAEIIDPSFTVDRCVFDTEEFLRVLKGGLDDKTLKRGSVIIYDEMGIGHSNRNFYDALNKALNYVFQGFRRENLIVFMTVPKMKFVDVQTRELMHYIINPVSIDKANGICWSRGYIVDQNSLLFGEPMYLNKMKVCGNPIDGDVVESQYFGLRMPSEKLRTDYEAKKKEYMHGIYDRALALAMAVKDQRIGALSRKDKDGESNNKPITHTPSKKGKLSMM